MSATPSAGGRLLVPEVVQTSAMDCGPAALKCLLEGFGIAVSYGRLREACQTDVDGTSIDTLEEVAVQLGLEAEQVMLPVDHLLLPEARPCPPSWSSAAQRLDPLRGRLAPPWPRRPADGSGPPGGAGPPASASSTTSTSTPCRCRPGAWREWAGSEEFLGALRGAGRLGLSAGDDARLVDAPCWTRLAAAGGPRRRHPHGRRVVRAAVCGAAAGRERSSAASNVLEERRARSETIPADYWSVRAPPVRTGRRGPALLRGAVLVRVRGRRRRALSRRRGAEPPDRSARPELARGSPEPPSRPGASAPAPAGERLAWPAGLAG